MKAKLKNTEFEYIVFEKDNEENFSKIKHFCGDKVTITYETCAIGDYWCIKLIDFSEREVVVRNYDYIVKLGDGKFVRLDHLEFDESFNIVEKEE